MKGDEDDTRLWCAAETSNQTLQSVRRDCEWDANYNSNRQRVARTTTDGTRRKVLNSLQPKAKTPLLVSNVIKVTSSGTVGLLNCLAGTSGSC